jgi:uncharacterized membrane protein
MVTNKTKKRNLPMTKDTKLHVWSFSLATMLAVLVLSPIGQLAAQVAGY